MSDAYEATFTWPAGPNEVIITGTFDNWAKSTKLIRSWEGTFSVTLKFPWASKILFKYIVDGQWVTSRQEKTEIDANGHVNNVFQVPPNPALEVKTEVKNPPAPAPSKTVIEPSSTTTNATNATSKPTPVASAPSASAAVAPPPEPEAPASLPTAPTPVLEKEKEPTAAPAQPAHQPAAELETKNTQPNEPSKPREASTPKAAAADPPPAPAPARTASPSPIPGSTPSSVPSSPTKKRSSLSKVISYLRIQRRGSLNK